MSYREHTVRSLELHNMRSFVKNVKSHYEPCSPMRVRVCACVFTKGFLFPKLFLLQEA